MPVSRREFLLGGAALGAEFIIPGLLGGCAAAPSAKPVRSAAATPVRKDPAPAQLQAASQFRLIEDTVLPNPETAIQQITTIDEIIAKHYPEMGDTRPKDAVRIQTPNNSLFFFYFTDHDFDPVAALQTYSFYERFARSGYSGTFTTLSNQKVPFKIMPPGKANILVFIIPEDAPDAEWILKYGGADKPAGTLLYKAEGLNLTRIREAMPKAGSASNDIEIAGSIEKYTDLLFLIEAGQSIINMQTQFSQEVSNRMADSFNNQLARAIYNRRLGKTYAEYIRNKKPGSTGYIVDKNLIIPADPIGEAIYNQLPVIPPVIKPTIPENRYSSQE